MPGVPTSRRCMSCKKRKVKCDLKWPCSSCRRLNVSCSGPQEPFKIILNGSHAAPVYVGEASAAAELKKTPEREPNDAAADAENATNPWHVIQTAYQKDKRHVRGGSYGFFRLTPRPRVPKGNPVSDVDSLAAHLVSHICTPNFADSATGLEYIKYLPRRLAESEALRDSVTLFLSSWTNYWRGAPPGEIIDARLQSRALRSLYQELASPRKLASETLAAVTVLQRLEILMESSFGDKNRFVHSMGMLSLMAQKGPPKIDDALDVRMALDNHRTPLGLWMVRNDECIFFDDKWRGAMEKAAAIDDDERKIGSVFSLESLYWRWPPLVHELKALGEMQREGVRPNDRRFVARLRQLHLQAQDTLVDTRLVGEAILERAWEAGYIVETPYPASPYGKSVSFHSMRYCELLANYLIFQIILLRMLRYMCQMQGLEQDDYEIEQRELSRKCLAFCPYLRRKGPIACAQYSCALFFALDELEDDERIYMIRFIMDVTGMELGDEEAAVALLGKVADQFIGLDQFSGIECRV